MIAALTGAGGFIGRAAADALRASGIVVRAHQGPEDFDIAQAAEQHDFFAGADVVIHLAGPPSVAQSLADPVECVRAHVVGTASVVEAMRRCSIKRIVFISSAEVYGDAGAADVREDAPLAPRSPYGAAKAGAEFEVGAGAASYGLRGYILRLFSVYGPGASIDGVIHAIITQARANDVIELNDLAPVRDYCFVEDVAAAIVRACTVDAPGMEILNIGTGIGTTVLDLARVVDGLVNGSTKEIRQRSGATRAGEIYRLVADVSAARSVLSWSAQHDLKTGLSRTLGIPVS